MLAWLLLGCWSLAGGAGSALADGRAIFADLAGAAPITARLATGVPLPATGAGCATCHGLDGEGGRDAGISAPPINALALTKGGYGLAAFAAALRTGTGSDGRQLHQAMPRYTITDRDLGVLHYYLVALGGQREELPGVTADRIRIGMISPGDPGSAALHAALAASLADLGPIYGRRLELVAAPTLADLIAGESVLALLAGRPPPEGEALQKAAEVGLPWVAPLSLETPPARLHAVSLLPDVAALSRVLVDYAVGRKLSAGLLVDGDDPRLAAAQDAARAQAALHGWPLPATSRGEDALLAFTRPTRLIELLAADAEVTGEPPLVMTVLGLVDRGVLEMAARHGRTLVIAAPAETDPLALGQAGARRLASALIACGHQPTRGRLIRALDESTAPAPAIRLLRLDPGQAAPVQLGDLTTPRDRPWPSALAVTDGALR